MDEIILRKELFGAEVEIVAFGSEESVALPVLEEAYKEGVRLQKIFNFFDPESVLSKLNQERRIIAPVELLEVLTYALSLCEETNGLYDISLGKNFLQRKNKQEVLPLSCSYRDIQIKEDEVTLLHADVMVDLGSVAKGFIADRIAQKLLDKGMTDGLVDARGDIKVFGNPLLLDVQHPRNKEDSVSTIEVVNSGVATSGDYNQFDEVFEKSHILNSNELISVTVIAPSLMEADGCATAIFVLTIDKIEGFVKDKPIKVLCINKDLNVRMYNQFEEVLHTI